MEIRPSLVIYEIRGGLLKHKKSPKHKPRVCAPSLTLITPPSLASATANLDLRSFFTIDFVRNFFRLLPIWRIEKRSAGHCRGFSSHLNISQRYIYHCNAIPTTYLSLHDICCGRNSISRTLKRRESFKFHHTSYLVCR